MRGNAHVLRIFRQASFYLVRMLGARIVIFVILYVDVLALFERLVLDLGHGCEQVVCCR